MGRQLTVLDASVLIALLDEQDAGRAVARAAVDQGRRNGDLLIPATAFSESIVAPYRRSRADGEKAESALLALGRLVDVTRVIASQAAQLRSVRRIKLPDAMILATAVEVSADHILTLDKRWEGVDPRVRVLDPKGGARQQH